MQPQQPQGLPPQQPGTPHPYEFILNPETGQAPPSKVPIPGSGSPVGRVIVVIAGLIVLLILFTLVKGLVSPKPNLTPFIGLMADQQAIINLTSAQSLSSGGRITVSQPIKNISATTQLSLTSDQTDIARYLKANGVKPKKYSTILEAQLDTKVSAQLTTAANDSTYETVYKGLLRQELTGYSSDLKKAYNEDKGPKGRALLSHDYDAAQKLLAELARN